MIYVNYVYHLPLYSYNIISQLSMSQTLLSQSRFYFNDFSLDTFYGSVCFADPFVSNCWCLKINISRIKKIRLEISVVWDELWL